MMTMKANERYSETEGGNEERKKPEPKVSQA